MDNEKTCATCFWSSMYGYCTEGGRPPQQYKEACDKHTPKMNISSK